MPPRTPPTELGCTEFDAACKPPGGALVTHAGPAALLPVAWLGVVVSEIPERHLPERLFRIQQLYDCILGVVIAYGCEIPGRYGRSRPECSKTGTSCVTG